MAYNNNMNKRERWTIIDVDEDVILLVKEYAKKNGYTTGRALSELIKIAQSK